MALTQQEFDRLPYRRKLQVVFTQGIHLARRPCTSYYVDLFHVPGSYCVECFYLATTRRLVFVRSLRACCAYGPYLAGIELPAGLP